MKIGLSTQVLLPLRLSTALLDALRDAGARAIEVFAARHHFDYTDRSEVRELASWFRSNDLPVTLHQPLFTDTHWSRHAAPTVNLIDVEKSRRIDAMDEVKRALEAAEQIPFDAAVLHLGQKGDAWSPRSLEHSLTAIEHLKAFAAPLGVRLLLENLQNEVTTPEHLLEIVRVGHFTTVGFCLDVGHAQLAGPEQNRGVEEAFKMLGPSLGEVHLHDNHGQKDEHLWPGTGSLDAENLHRHLALLPPAVPVLLEIAHDLNETPATVAQKMQVFLDEQSRRLERGAQAEAGK
jgi:sugar phosphate isomerase/epimerase